MMVNISRPSVLLLKPGGWMYSDEPFWNRYTNYPSFFSSLKSFTKHFPCIYFQGDVPAMLTYCLKVCLELLQHRQFRNVVLRCLVDMYRELTTPDYVSMCQCLIFLDDPLAVADILDKLVHGEQDSTLMAYQIAFDLYESATQQFLARVLQALKPTNIVPPGLF
jgi:hypothetical protein